MKSEAPPPNASVFTFSKGSHRYVFLVERGRELSMVSVLLEMAQQPGLNIGFEDVLRFIRENRERILRLNGLLPGQAAAVRPRPAPQG